MRNKLSLQLTLVVQAIFTALAPVIIVAILLLFSFRTLLIEQQQQTQAAQADKALNQVAFDLEKLYLALSKTAENSNVALSAQSGLFGYSARNAMQELLATHSMLSSVMIIDAQQFVVEASPESSLLIDLSPLENDLQQVLQEGYVDGPKSTLISSPDLVSQLPGFTPSQEDTRVLLMTFPLVLTETNLIDARASVTGVMLAFVTWSSIQQSLQTASPNLTAWSAAPDMPDNLQRNNMFTKTALPIPGGNDSEPIYFYAPNEQVITPVNALINEFIGYTLIVVSALLLLLFYIVRWQLKPLNVLNRTVKHYASGELQGQRQDLPFREFDDISAVLHEMAENLSEQQSELEKRVVERTRELQLALDNVKRVNEELVSAQKQLVESEKLSQLGVVVAGVAHEINTPVGVCVTATSLLKDKLTVFKQQCDSNHLTKSALHSFLADADNCVDILTKNTERAAELIHSFKAISVDQSSEQPRDFSVHEYIDLILRSVRNKLVKSGVEVNLSGDPQLFIQSYPGSLSQIMTNLVLNSLKHAFTSKEGNIIEIRFYLHDKSRLVLNYKDNGVGVAKQDLPKLFDPFFTTKRNQGGSGLGLNIVHNIVNQQLKGSISCESEPNKGFTVSIVYPVKKVERLAD